MTTIEGNERSPGSAGPKVSPCNFRSAGRLSNESARSLRTLHEVLARNLSNSLDVYLGTGLEVRLVSLEQLTMEDFKTKCVGKAYMLPYTMRPSTGTVLLEMQDQLMFTIVDLLLGGTGAKLEIARDLTEIDEEIMEGVGALIAQQIERVWPTLGSPLAAGKCLKSNMAHRLFPPTDKVLRIHFDMSVAGMTGSVFLAFPAALAGHLVRNMRNEMTTGGSVRYLPLASLQKRMLECRFALSGDLPDLRVSVRELAQIQPGSVLMLAAPVAGPGKLALEGKLFFEAQPVRQGDTKAMQLLKRLNPEESETDEE